MTVNHQYEQEVRLFGHAVAGRMYIERVGEATLQRERDDWLDVLSVAREEGDDLKAERCELSIEWIDESLHRFALGELPEPLRLAR